MCMGFWLYMYDNVYTLTLWVRLVANLPAVVIKVNSLHLSFDEACA